MQVSREMLQVACLAYNNIVGDSRQHLKLKDLDNLTSDIMMQIIASLLSGFEPCFASGEVERKTSVLPDWKKITGGDALTYDSTVDHVYSVAKKFFPEGDGTLDMCVLLCPTQDVQRTKEVICYLTSFVLFADQINDTFRAEWDNINRENTEKSELYAEIDAIKIQIAEKAIQLEAQEEEKPIAEAKLASLEKDILQEQEKLASMENLAKKEKKNYDEKAAENHKLAEKLQTLEADQAELESQIVESANEILEQYQKEDQQLKADNQKRELLGEALKQVGTQEQFVQDMIEKAQQSVQRFEKLIANMQAGGDLLATYNRGQNNHKVTLKELDGIKKSGAQLDLQRQRLDNELKNRHKVHKDKLDEIALLNNKIQENTAQSITTAKQKAASITGVLNEVKNVQQDILATNQEIQKQKAFVEVEIPAKRAELTEFVESFWSKCQSLYEAEAGSIGLDLNEEEGEY